MAPAVYLRNRLVSLAAWGLETLVRGWRSSAPEDWAGKCDGLPLLKAFTAHMDSEPRVRAFLQSDRCTKMEDPNNTPTATADSGVCQTNSFM